MASYYKRINGKNYDRAILESAKSSVEGQGDGRISLKDSKEIVKLIKDGGRITEIEKRSLQYILEKYKFTKTALKHIEQALAGAADVTKAKPAAVKTPAAQTVKIETEPPAKPEGEKKTVWEYIIIFLLLILLVIGICFLYSKYKARSILLHEQDQGTQTVAEVKPVECWKD